MKRSDTQQLPYPHPWGRTGPDNRSVASVVCHQAWSPGSQPMYLRHLLVLAQLLQPLLDLVEPPFVLSHLLQIAQGCPSWLRFPVVHPGDDRATSLMNNRHVEHRARGPRGAQATAVVSEHSLTTRLSSYYTVSQESGSFNTFHVVIT